MYSHQVQVGSHSFKSHCILKYFKMSTKQLHKGLQHFCFWFLFAVATIENSIICIHKSFVLFLNSPNHLEKIFFFKNAAQQYITPDSIHL